MDTEATGSQDAWDEYLAALTAFNQLVDDMLDQSIKISQAALETLEAQKQLLNQ